MGNTFLTATANFEDFFKISSGEISPYVLKNNESSLKKIFAFFQCDNNILLINGFTGTGKKQIAEHILSYMDKDTIVCRFVCSTSSRLDDIELSFYKTLQKKTALKDTTELDAINTIKDKIDYLIAKLPLRFVFAFYNFDDLQNENKTEILNYTYSFTENPNVKSIIVSRIFDTEIFPIEQKYTRVMIKALSKEIFESCIKDCGIKISASMLEQFYRLTRGYFFSTCLSCKIMINRELTVNDFIIQYSNSGLKFDEFLAKTYYTLIVGTTKSAFNLFLKLHHGLNLKLIQHLGSYPEIVLKTLSDNFYIFKKNDLYYASGFLKQHLEQIAKDEISKERLATYYEKQLELSPTERDITISRASLSHEIAFYKNIQIEEPQKTIEEHQEAEKPKEEISSEPIKVDTKINEYLNLPIIDILKESTETFCNYDYLKTLELLSVILSRKYEIKDNTILYATYNMLAKTYSKLTKWKYALYYYEILEKYYTNIGNKDSVNIVKFEIANIYYQTYRTFDAIKLLRELLAVTKDNQIIVNCNILLGNISLSASHKDLAIKYYKDGIDNIDANTEKSTAVELFFKFAILSDENNDINNAVEYYQRVIEINDTKSKYTALANSNLGDLFLDNELFDEAKDCFKKAYEIDSTNNNDYGMYYSLSKIIELTSRQEKDKRLTYAKEAKEHALKSNDYHAIVDATLKLGDLYYDYSQAENALNEYIELYRADKNKFSEYNLNKLTSRLDDIKARLGKDTFEKLIPDYE